MQTFLGPPQTSYLVVDNYLLSTTKCYRQLILSDASIGPARAWELTYTTHAHNAERFQNGLRSYDSCQQLNQ